MTGQAMSTEWQNCTIGGEGSGNNPEYCLAFYDSKPSNSASPLSERSSKKEEPIADETLDCCWTANEHSTLPPLLSDLVTLHSNGTM